MDSPGRVRKFLIGLAIAGLLVFVITLIVHHKDIGGGGGDEDDDRNKRHVVKWQAVHSYDELHLVNVSSYVVLLSGQNRIVPLELERLDVFGWNARRERLLALELTYDVALVMINLELDTQTNVYSMKLLELYLTENGKDKPEWLGFNDEFKLQFGRNQRYSCLGTQAIRCATRRRNKTEETRPGDFDVTKPGGHSGATTEALGENAETRAAELMFDVFEIELNGNRARIAQNQFSREPDERSCNINI